MKLGFGAAIAAAGALAMAAPASAATFSVVYEGVIVGAYDTFNTYGGAIVDFAPFKLTFTVDTALGGPGASGATFDTLEGYGSDNPVTGVLEIGSATLNFGQFYGYDYRYDTGAEAGLELLASDRVDDFDGPIYTYVSGRASATAYGFAGQFGGLQHTAPGAYSTADGAQFFGDFSKEAFVYSYLTGQKTGEVEVGGRLKIESISLAAVPEPGTWALMILGFGTVGAALRRRALSLP